MHSLLFYLYINKKCRGGYQPPSSNLFCYIVVLRLGNGKFLGKPNK